MKILLTPPPSKFAEGVSEGLDVWSYPKYATFKQHQEVFEETTLYRAVAFNITGDGETERVLGEEVTAGYFPMLGVSPEIGRTFHPDEDSIPPRNFVAVISHSLWQPRFGADPNVVGKPITLDLKNYTVIGVLHADFQGLFARDFVGLRRQFVLRTKAKHFDVGRCRRIGSAGSGSFGHSGRGKGTSNIE